jgi:MFS family permease
MALFGAPVAAAFALLHGAGNGILTGAKGTLPLALFGPAGYGHRQGMLMLPARLAQALAPWLFGLLLAALGTRVLWVSGGLALSAMVALLFIHVPARRDSPPVLKPSEETACGARRCARLAVDNAMRCHSGPRRCGTVTKRRRGRPRKIHGFTWTRGEAIFCTRN